MDTNLSPYALVPRRGRPSGAGEASGPSRPPPIAPAVTSPSSRSSPPGGRPRRCTYTRKTRRPSTSSKVSSRSTSTTRAHSGAGGIVRSRPGWGGARLPGGVGDRALPHHHHRAARTLLPGRIRGPGAHAGSPAGGTGRHGEDQRGGAGVQGGERQPPAWRPILKICPKEDSTHG
jgi:hypothetical protein